MSERVVSFKTGRKPLLLQPLSSVRAVTGILGAFARACDEIHYPDGATDTEKDLIFCDKIGVLSADHPDLTADNLKATCDYLEASIKYFNDCRVAGDEAIERTGGLITRDLTGEEMTVFHSMDAMNADKLAEMKLFIDLLTAKWRASTETSPVANPENSSNETILIYVRHIMKTNAVRKPESKFTSRKQQSPTRPLRTNMCVDTDTYL